MTNLTTLRTRFTTCFTYRICREVVVQHEVVSFCTCKGINHQRITCITQSRCDQGLSFTTCEQCRTVSTIQYAYLYVDCTNSFGITTIDTWLTRQDVVTYSTVFKVFEQLIYFFCNPRFVIFRNELCHCFCIKRVKCRITVLLNCNRVRFRDFRFECFFQFTKKFFIFNWSNPS